MLRYLGRPILNTSLIPNIADFVWPWIMPGYFPQVLARTLLARRVIFWIPCLSFGSYNICTQHSLPPYLVSGMNLFLFTFVANSPCLRDPWLIWLIEFCIHSSQQTCRVQQQSKPPWIDSSLTCLSEASLVTEKRTRCQVHTYACSRNPIFGFVLFYFILFYLIGLFDFPILSPSLPDRISSENYT